MRVTGDGKSKQTAILFSDVRTHMEHITLQYEFIRDKGIEVVGLRCSVQGDDGHLYDVWPTSEGELWFKVPPDADTSETVREMEATLKKRQSSFLEFDARVPRRRNTE